MKENVGSFVAAVEATRAADFPYTVTVVTAPDTALGKHGSCSIHVVYIDAAYTYRHAKYPKCIIHEHLLAAL